MKLKLTPGMIVALGGITAIGYLYLTDALTQELFFLFAIIVFGAAAYSTKEKEIITIKQATKIAYDYIILLQERDEISSGTVRVEEAELKDIILKTPTQPTVKPDRYLVKIVVEPSYAYLVKISIYGTILGYSEIKLPDTYRVSEVKDREVEAALQRVDDETKPEEDEENE